jgi:predicted flap endonuclease-1-like 5' DNA nuclease
MALTEDRLPPVADRAAERDLPDPAAARARLRALRAERLARLHAAPAPEPAPIPAPAPEAPPAPSAAGPAPRPAPEDLADPEALVAFLRALTGDAEPHTEPLDAPRETPRPAAEVLHFHRPVPVDPVPDPPAAEAEASPEPEAIPAKTPVPASDLDRLPGVGPGLLWALGQAGITRLADLAPLAPEDLAARLGPLGRLVPAATWIAAARAAEA